MASWFRKPSSVDICVWPLVSRTCHAIRRYKKTSEYLQNDKIFSEVITKYSDFRFSFSIIRIVENFVYL